MHVENECCHWRDFRRDDKPGSRRGSERVRSGRTYEPKEQGWWFILSRQNNNDMVLKTGDILTVDGKIKTIVIYGDTNSDGKINILDAVNVLNHIKGIVVLTAAQYEATKKQENELAILDAVRILNVVKGLIAYTDIVVK